MNRCKIVLLVFSLLMMIGFGCATKPKSVETQIVEKTKVVLVPTRAATSVSDSAIVDNNLKAATTAAPAKSESVWWLVLQMLTPLIAVAVLGLLLLVLIAAEVRSIRRRLRERRDLRDQSAEELRPRRRASASGH